MTRLELLEKAKQALDGTGPDDNEMQSMSTISLAMAYIRIAETLPPDAPTRAQTTARILKTNLTDALTGKRGELFADVARILADDYEADSPMVWLFRDDLAELLSIAQAQYVERAVQCDSLTP